MCGGPGTGIPGEKTARGFSERPWRQAHACRRGSPFHLPTELAVGLDLGSGPRERLPAPVSPVLPPARKEFGSPVCPPRKGLAPRRLICWCSTWHHSHARLAESNTSGA